MAWQEADETALLAFLLALALAQGKNAEEVGVLAGFTVAVGDILALLSVVLAVEESRLTAQKEKESAAALEARLKKIEGQLKALLECCETKE